MPAVNILAVRNDRFGEFILNIPALRALKEGHPESKLILVVNPYVRELAESIDFVDEIITWDNRQHKLIDVFRFSRLLRSRKFGICVIFNPSKEFNIISFLAGIPIRVGYQRKWGLLLNRKIPDRKHIGDRHEVEYNMELSELAGAKSGGSNISLKIDEGAISDLLDREVLDSPDRLVAIHPWTSDSRKQWAVVNFSDLSQRLAGLPNIKVIIIGGRDEQDRGVSLFSNTNDRFINLVGRTSLRQLATLLKKCSLLVSGDSGPVHLAAAVGTPVIALFRNDLPGKTAKRWGPWGNGHIVIEKKSLSQITVEEVFEKIKEVLKK